NLSAKPSIPSIASALFAMSLIRCSGEVPSVKYPSFRKPLLCSFSQSYGFRLFSVNNIALLFVYLRSCFLNTSLCYFSVLRFFLYSDELSRSVDRGYCGSPRTDYVVKYGLPFVRVSSDEILE